MSLVIKGGKEFNSSLKLGGDKSISHRCAIFSLLSNKPSVIGNYLQAQDTINSLNIARSLGAIIETANEKIQITPPTKIQEPSCILECGNSGTSMRSFIGLLASQNGQFVLSGDKYLNSRPMARVITPLNSIGADIKARDKNTKAPIVINGKTLKGFSYKSPISSAQVKTAMILAGLFATENSSFSEPFLSRDHTENMLQEMGAELFVNKDKIEISPLKEPLKPLNIDVAGDPSSAFFFIVLATINPNSSLKISNVSLNKTRIEAFKVLEQMGADLRYEPKSNNYEPSGDIFVKSAKLKAVNLSQNIAWLIDEIPALAIAFAFANGTSFVSNAKELRVKETDRIKAIVSNLNSCGIKATEQEDGFSVTGGEFKGGLVDSFGDHRIAMSFAIAGFVGANVEINDTECVNTSFANFFEILKDLGAILQWK